MKQNKDKEIRDLKWEIYDLGDDVGDWKFYTCFFGMMVGVITFLLIFSFVDWVGLEQELQSCQDKVPVWTLKFECSDANVPWLVMETNENFSDYKKYQNRLRFIEENKNCEVIE
ncbi:hypothetical protein LCGC14_0509190 [marine sediment metagenome]|uniref:Uncharacterized protein n=1 Tax=marine sediment metagenome TaxID=412755 RepID=A0A0F9V9Y4_9ZZZZ|nr:hypothetical protein [bacterium]